MHYQHRLERLISVVQDLSHARSHEAVREIVKRAARGLTGADGATFILRDNGFCHYVDEDAIGPLWKGSRFPLDNCIGGWVMKHRRPAVIRDVFADERIPHSAYRKTFIKSLAVVPIRTQDPVGAIGNYWAEHRTPSDEEVRLLQALADTTAVAMENVQVYSELEDRVRARTVELREANARLAGEIEERKRAEEEIRQLSLTDELTGLYNRRGFYLMARQERKLAQRVGRDCTLVFVDLDGLKWTNDSFGHDIGDCLIRDAARILRQTFREADVVARFGGDEFAVFAVGCESEGPAMDARLQDSVAAFNSEASRPYPLSMSVGVLDLSAHNEESLESLVAEVDRRMYEAKRARRQSARGQRPIAAGVSSSSQCGDAWDM